MCDLCSSKTSPDQNVLLEDCAMAWMRRHLGLPPPETSMEETSMEALLVALEEKSQSGVKYVYCPANASKLNLTSDQVCSVDLAPLTQQVRLPSAF